MTAPAPSLRAPREEDIPALAALGRSSFVAKFGHLYDPADLEAFLGAVFSEAAIAAELANPARAYRLAEEQGALVGYCKIGFGSDYAEYSAAAKPGEIKQLYTDPARTGRGIGAKLMDWALAELARQGSDTILLTVFSENHDAQRFYTRYGFSKIADIHFWVGNHRDDEFLYELRLG